MNTKTVLGIDIASEFDEKGFRAAQNATKALDATVGRLGRTFAATFSAYKIAQFGKASVKAFMEDEQAARSLANQLRNIGYGSATAGAEDFIAAMQKQTGILDDVLRPAYSELARVTGDLGTTQNILKTAWNVSAGTGKDFASVVDSLSQAYVGNTKGLKALDTGLTNAELSGKSFSEIMGTLNQQFAGAGQASLNSYAGQISLLSATVASSMETIGKSILDGFAIINGDTGIGGTISAIETATDKLSDFLRLTSASVGVLKTAFDPKNWFNPERAKKQIDDILSEYRLKQSIAEQQRTFTEWIPNTPWTAEQKKAAAAAAARAKELAALTKKQAAAQADLNKKKQDAAKLDALSLKYKQAEGIFNMEQIELAAASMNKQTQEDYARIKLKQDLITLQNAIAAGDLEAAQSAAAVVEQDYKRVWAYQAQNIALGIQNGTIANIKNAASLIPTDLQLIDLDNLDSALAAIKALIAEMNKLPITTPTSKYATAASGAPAGGANFVNPLNMGNKPADVTDEAWKKVIAGLDNAAAEQAGSPLTVYDFGGLDFNPNAVGSYGVSNPNIKIVIEDNSAGLVNIIPDATQQASANGVNTRIIRNTGNLSW